VAVRHIVKFIIVLFLCSCQNPFATRTPEPPETGRLNLLPRNSPENVFYNFKKICENLSRINYPDCFTEDFSFVPDPRDYSEHEQVFSGGWGREKEMAFASNIFDKKIVSSISFSPPPQGGPSEFVKVEDLNADSVRYEYNYNVKIAHNIQNAPSEIKGRSILSFKRDVYGNWAIYLWVDEKIYEDKSTWGELRAAFWSGGG